MIVTQNYKTQKHVLRREPQLEGKEPISHSDREKSTDLSLKAALDFIVPTWPLQNTVAVNPFWHLKGHDIHAVLEEMATIIHHPLYMSLDYYLDKYQSGAITDRALSASLKAMRLKLNSVPDHIDELVQHSKMDRDISRRCVTFAEFYDREKGSTWALDVKRHVSQYAAAYFDQGQSVYRFPWKNISFWEAWKTAQNADWTMEACGIADFSRHLRIPSEMSAQQFVKSVLLEFNFPSHLVETRYLRRLLATTFGWATQFQLGEWRKRLGYADPHLSDPTELLAVLVAYDHTLAKIAQKNDPHIVSEWKKTISPHLTADESRVHSFELHQIWQAALELSYQTHLSDQIENTIRKSQLPSTPAVYQVAMCIDVRSEVLRRALEAVSLKINTIGFAGFFGLPFNYQQVDEKSSTQRLPVLLPASFAVLEKVKKPDSIIRKTLVQSFFRNLRKAPLSSFAYVEIFGVYSLFKMAKEVCKSSLQGKQSNRTPQRFYDGERGPDVFSLCQHDGTMIDSSGKVERAASILRHMGLLDVLKLAPPRLLVITGHGSNHTNNAFRSSLDCGACGGHAGDINARIVADLLNAPKIRDGLRDKGIVIPEETWVVAALHETVTDQVYLLDQQQIPSSHLEDVKNLAGLFEKASNLARQERQATRSSHLDPDPFRRSRNWSEIRPEWGLAGNAAFIVAPRSFSKHINLKGRVFLHDYQASADEGFLTLELIMTAPMIVTHWINFQYYASTVAPDFYGSGNKLIHNLVNESGVFEGNGGDLRIGLPIQSIHDGDKFVHEPLRLTVFIAAPRNAIEDIINKHETVKQLIDHGWLHLMHIDEKSKTVTRRRPGGLYIPFESLEAIS